MAQILDNQCSKSCDTLNKRKTSNTLFDIILKSKCYPLSYIILLPLQTPSLLAEPKIQLAQDRGDRGGKVCTIISDKPARALFDFHSMRQPGQYYLPPPPPPWIKCQSITRSPSSISSGFPDNSSVSSYTPW